MSDPEPLDLGGAIRESLMGVEPITSELGQYKGEPSIFTKRPIPAEATYPLIVINPDSAIGDEDGLTSDRPLVIRDLAAYGQQPDHLRAVERIGYRMRAHFHRRKFSVTPQGYDVIDIRAAGPIPAPVDDADTVGRMVSLTIRLRSKS